MKKKEITLLIISAIFIVLIISSLQNKGILSGAYHPPSQFLCEERRASSNDACSMPCFEMTSIIANCVSNYGYNGYTDEENIGDWYYFHDDDKTCPDYYGGMIASGEEKELGLYHCVEIFRNCVDGTSCGGHSCGNGMCESSESVSSCPEDCKEPPTCGNGVCDSGETYKTCPEDCNDNGGDNIVYWIIGVGLVVLLVFNRNKLKKMLK